MSSGVPFLRSVEVHLSLIRHKASEKWKTKSGNKSIFLTLILICANGLAIADGFDQYRIACNSKETLAIQAAVEKAKELAQRASLALPPIDSAGGARFRKWFGGPDGDYDPVIKKVYEEMAVTLIFQKFWCLPPNSTTPEEWIHTNAFILRGKVGEIFVTSNFFTLPLTGPMSSGGTIVHEASHQSRERKIVDDDVDGDKKNDYGPNFAKQRALKTPGKARSNADNFKYFSEDVVYGVP